MKNIGKDVKHKFKTNILIGLSYFKMRASIIIYLLLFYAQALS